MLIKDQQGHGPNLGLPPAGWFSSIIKLWRWLVALALVAVVFVSGIAFQRADLVGPLVNGFLTNASLPSHLIRGALADVDRLTFDITYDNYQKLNYKRLQALERGILVTDDDSWVSAQIRYNGRIMRSKVRLKGDLPDHLNKKQWSLRVSLRDDSTLYGMKRFSLQNPATRNYVHEWIFHQAAKQEGLISLRYRFVNVTINGEDKGLYALEESFEKRLLENNQRREAPIVKFDENPWWVESGGYVRDYALPGVGHYNSLPIEMFQTNKTLSDSTLSKQFLLARDLLAGFRTGELSASEVFDIELQARYFALIDLLGGFHALNTIQLRFYFNPLTAKLEPIPFDANAGRVTPEVSALFKADEEDPWNGDLRERYTGAMFADTAFYRLYLGELDRMSRPQYLEALLVEHGEDLDSELSKIYSDHPEYRFDRSVLEINRRFIRSFLEPVVGVNAYLEHATEQELTLQVSATQQLPVEVTAIVYSDSSVKTLETATFIAGKDLRVPSEFIRVDSKKSGNAEQHEVTGLRYRVFGLTEERDVNILPWPSENVSRIVELIKDNRTSLKRYDFLNVDESLRTISAPEGVWSIKGQLIIPPAYRFVLSAGTILEFVDESSHIISHSPLEFNGTSEKPVIIRGGDGPNHNGLVVLSAKEQSKLTHVRFESLGVPVSEQSSFTGAVTFYKSPVEMRNCEFINNHSEDALNCILSGYKLLGCVFSEIQSDAFDGDFSDGEIVDCRFVNCGNDAIDVSGSEIFVSQVSIISAQDKALSIGEGSSATVSDLQVRNTEIAIASKDNSRVTITNLQLDSCRVGFTVFQKKSEFGPAAVTVSGIDTSAVGVPFLIEERSTLFIDGIRITSDQLKVKDQLYGIKYGASSK